MKVGFFFFISAIHGCAYASSSDPEISVVITQVPLALFWLARALIGRRYSLQPTVLLLIFFRQYFSSTRTRSAQHTLMMRARVGVVFFSVVKIRYPTCSIHLLNLNNVLFSIQINFLNSIMVIFSALKLIRI